MNYDDPRYPKSYATMILRGLQRLPHIYSGSVDNTVVQERRTKNRAARKSRRINRLSAQKLH